MSHDRLGMPMEVDDSFKKAHVEDWVFQIPDPSDFSLPRGQGDIFPETPEVTHHKGKHRSLRFLLVLRNTLRNHCLRCSHDLHVNVWSYLSPVVLYC